MIQRMLSLMLVAFLGAAYVTAQQPRDKPVDPGKPGTPDGGGKPDNPGNKPPEPPKGKPETPPGKPHPVVDPLPVVQPPPVDHPDTPGTAAAKPDGQPYAFQSVPVTNTAGLVPPVHDASYAERAVFSADGAWQGRCAMAAMSVVQDVLAEPDTTPNHAARLKMAGQILREPDIAARRLARWLAVVVPVRADSRGYTASPVTDAQLRALVQQHWTALGLSLGQLF